MRDLVRPLQPCSLRPLPVRHLEDVSSPDQVSTPEQSEHEGDEDEGEGEEQLLESLVRKKRDIDAANEAMRSRVDAEMAGVMANGVTPNPHLYVQQTQR